MEAESLAALKKAFDEWRSGKRHVREAVPEPLLARARAATSRHGMTAVVRATKVDRERLAFGQRRRARGSAQSVPAFSRIEFAGPTATAFAEVEMSTGLKVRLFAPTAETLGLLSSILEDRKSVV